MDIRVISLSESRFRRANIAAQFAAIDIEFRFFDAVTACEAPARVAGYNESEFILNCGRAATDREIACYASHLTLWRQCVSANRPFLILEDDAGLTRSFCEGLGFLQRHVADRGLIRAALPLPRYSTRVLRENGFALHYCQRVPLQALGYALSPGAAARLVDAAETVEEPVDKFLQRFWRHGQRVFTIMPAIIEHSLFASTSDIGERRRPDYDVVTRLRRIVRKSANSLARTYSNVVHSQEAWSCRD